MSCIGMVFNTETYNKLKENLPTASTIGKTDLQRIAETFTGVPIYKKEEQKENCYAFSNKKLLDKYLAGTYDEEFLRLLLKIKETKETIG